MRKVQLVVLCEDGRDRNLVWAYLRRRKYNLGRVRFSISPAGRGAADRWVQSQYPSNVHNVRSYNARNAAKSRWLLVVTDADTRTVQRRLEELDEELAARLGTSERREPDDAVAALVPRRNIETWVYHLTRGYPEVSETIDYKRRVSIDDVKAAGGELAAADPTCRPTCPASLCTGYAELQRIS